MRQSDTIAAIATAHAAGGIGIIRISGEQALAVAALVFCPAVQTDLLSSPGYRAHYGKLCDPASRAVLDEGVCLVFRAPHSYTGEDVAELSCHGGLFLTQRVLQAVFAAGAVPAQAGEFTKRAFLNGKIDLTQAEAVMDLIGAQGESAANAALTALDGALHQAIAAVSANLSSACAALAVWVDYPDEDVPEYSEAQLLQTVTQASETLSGLLHSFSAGRAATQGVETAIIGRPNVGKSTFMNLLVRRERSIVTALPGTTRDVVEETVRLGGVILHIADTAGLRITDDPVESIGVRLAKERLERAELVLAVFDGSENLTVQDKEILQALQRRKAIAVVNKSDLPQQLDMAFLKEQLPVIPLSAVSGEGLQELSAEVAHLLGTAHFDPGAVRLANERQRLCCENALLCLSEAREALQKNMTLDAVTVLLESAVQALLDLTGRSAGEAVVDAVFSQFCVGK